MSADQRTSNARGGMGGWFRSNAAFREHKRECRRLYRTRTKQALRECKDPADVEPIDPDWEWW